MSNNDQLSSNDPSLSQKDLQSEIRSKARAFRVAEGLSEDNVSTIPPTSVLSPTSALSSAQVISIADGEALILFYPWDHDFNIGDVLYLRERNHGENGIIVQVLEKATASYPQADSKALFRLMASVRAAQINRSHNEPPETIDEFLTIRTKIRASIVNEKWLSHEGRIVTKNVDIFEVDPDFLLSQTVRTQPDFNLHLGDYHEQPLNIYGGGFEKVNIITGMKGSGKSHIAKGIISENIPRNMSAVVFDYNGEYDGVVSDRTLTIVPTETLKFRLDYMKPGTILDMFQSLSPFAEKTDYAVRATLPKILKAYIRDTGIPDLDVLESFSSQITSGKSEAAASMRASYSRSLEFIRAHNLIMSVEEALLEDEWIKAEHNQTSTDKLPKLKTISLRYAFQAMVDGATVTVFQIAGLTSEVQKTVVSLVLDHLIETCRKQTVAYQEKRIPFPKYPTVFFEEAHKYMDERQMNDLIPVIRHIGLNAVFVTNTPEALPSSVFRLVDNVIMTRLLNRKDIDRIVDCGLADRDTIEAFAQNLKEHHALLLSGLTGATQNFPLVFHVRDFGLPKSGETKSQWSAMTNNTASQG